MLVQVPSQKSVMDLNRTETTCTWSDWEEHKFQQLEQELAHVRNQGKCKEEENQELRSQLSAMEERLSSLEVSLTKAGTSAETMKLTALLSQKDLLIAMLEKDLMKQRQELADELSKRKAMQYELITAGRRFCDLQMDLAKKEQDISKLRTESSAQRRCHHPHAPTDSDFSASSLLTPLEKVTGMEKASAPSAVGGRTVPSPTSRCSCSLEVPSLTRQTFRMKEEPSPRRRLCGSVQVPIPTHQSTRDASISTPRPSGSLQAPPPMYPCVLVSGGQCFPMPFGGQYMPAPCQVPANCAVQNMK